MHKKAAFSDCRIFSQFYVAISCFYNTKVSLCTLFSPKNLENAQFPLQTSN